MKNRTLIVLLMMICSTNILLGQVKSGMLMFQVDGNNYVKKNYNKNGKLEDYQIIKIGETRSKGDKIAMHVRLYNYNNNDQLLDSSETKYICNPLDGQLLLNVFPFASFSANKVVNLKSKTENRLYLIYHVGNNDFHKSNILILKTPLFQ